MILGSSQQTRGFQKTTSLASRIHNAVKLLQPGQVLFDFMGPRQRQVLIDLITNSEESEYFCELVEKQAKVIEEMPKTYFGIVRSGKRMSLEGRQRTVTINVATAQERLFAAGRRHSNWGS